MNAEKQTPRAAWKRIARDCAIVAAITCALFAGVELIARALVEPPEENVHERTESFDVPPKQSGTFRIVAIGGSTVDGWPMPELGFVAQLEAGLRRLAPGVPVEAINLGYLGKSSEYVKRVVQQAKAYDPDLLIVMTGHNEYLSRTDEDQSLVGKFQRAALDLASVRYLVSKYEAGEPKPLSLNYYMPERIVPCGRSTSWFQNRIAAHRANLESIRESAAEQNLPVIFCTLPANIADWPPVHRLVGWSKQNPNYDADVAGIKASLAAGALEDAEKAIDAALARFGDDAMMLYLKGQVYRQSGKPGKAYDALVRAQDLDPFPQRALTSINDNVRTVCGEATGGKVFLADLARAFEAEAPSRLVGLEWIGDNVHPATLGNALIARELASLIASQGLLPGLNSSGVEPSTPQDWLDDFVAGIPAENRRIWLRYKVADGHSKYCQKYPFYDFELALNYKREALELALQIKNDDWGIHGELGTLLIMNGKTEEGLAKLREATAMKGSPLDPNAHGAVNWLPEALAKAGVSLESLSAAQE